MSDNSKREQIILALKNRLEDIPAIVKVRRVRPEFANIENFAHTEFPMIAIVGKLPKPVPHRPGRATGQHDKFISSLMIELFCYAMDNVNPDSLVSDLADDIWAKIYSDQILITDAYPKGLALEVIVSPEVTVGFWDPYVVFKMDCSYKYVHDTGGI